MKTVRSLIDQNATDQPEKTFLIAPETDTVMSYGQLQLHAKDIAKRLNALGIEKGDKAAFLLTNGYWTTALFLGVMYSDRVVVPLNAVSGESALSYVIGHSDCKVIFVNTEYRETFAGVLNQLPESIRLIDTDLDSGPYWPDTPDTGDTSTFEPCDVDEADDAVLIYTSGTTGRPKGVLLSHRNTVAGGENTANAHELCADDRGLCVLPLYHINAEMVTVMAPLVSGGSIVMPHRFSTSTFWELNAHHACTWFSVVPTIIAYLLELAEREGFDRKAFGGLTKLRFGRSASAPLAPEMHKAFEELFGVPIVETMGLTETAAQILSNPLPGTGSV